MIPEDAETAFQYCLHEGFPVQVTFERGQVTFDFNHVAHAEELRDYMTETWNAKVRLNPGPYYARVA